MEATAFIGVPDWRSVILAILFTVPWLAWLAGGRLRSPTLWLALLLGAAIFPFAIAWVQVPLQMALNQFWSASLAPALIQQYLLLLSLPSMVVASAVQETAKLACVGVGWALYCGRRGALAGLAFGAAAGAGFGGFEAYWALNRIVGVGWSWAMVDQGGPLALLGFVERFFAVPFHVGSGALAAYGLATRQTGRFWLLVVALHTALNFAAVLLHAGVLDAVAVEVWLAVGALLTIGLAVWFRSNAPVRGAMAG